MQTSTFSIQIGLKTLIVIAVAVLLVLGVIGVVKIIRSPATRLASLTSAILFSSERITINPIDAPIPSGESVALHWTHDGKTRDGSYELRFLCSDNFQLKLASGESIPCGISFPLGDVTSAIDLVPLVTAANPLSVPIAIGFIPSGALEQTLSAVTKILVTPAPEGKKTKPSTATPPPPSQGTGGTQGGGASGTSTAAVTITDGKQTTKIYPVGCQNKILLDGTPDLAVKIADTGVVDGAAGNFTATSSVSRGQFAAIVFDVSNIGTAVSGTWQFSANLPTYESYFVSDPQDPISPCDHVRFTLGFRTLNNQGSNVATITLDPQNALKEANRANDTATTTIFRAY